MLTGCSVFEAEDVSQTLASVLERQPEFSALPRNLHPKIVEMLERCLEKEAKNRYSGISDARVDIQKVLEDPGRGFARPVAIAEAQTRPCSLLKHEMKKELLLHFYGQDVYPGKRGE